MKKILLIIILIVLVCAFFIQKQEFSTQEKDTINFYSWGSQSEISILKEILKDFENETKLKVNFIHIPQNYFQKLHLLFASNSKIDVITINNQYIKTYINADLLIDLNEHIEKDIFYEIALNAFKNKNGIYAIPRDISNLVLYVNKDILKKRNIAYKTKLSSLNELQEYAKALTFNNTFGINSEENSLFWIYYLAANGGGVLSDNGEKVILKNKESIDAINFYSDLINKYNIAPTKAQIGSMTTAQMFINEKLSMYLGGRWLIPKFREAISFDWDIIEFPSSKDNKTYIDASGWAISKKTKNVENSIKLIKYLSSEKSIERFSKSGLIVPARKDIAMKYIKSDKNKKPKHSEIFIDMLSNAKPTPVNKNYNKINDILNEEIQNVLSGNEKAEEAFNEKIIKEIEGLL